ncbi:hypothetical protein ScPMuIL_002761 [Solemya velum]
MIKLLLMLSLGGLAHGHAGLHPISYANCATWNPESAGTKAMPDIDDQFEVYIKANLITQGKTVFVREHRDKKVSIIHKEKDGKQTKAFVNTTQSSTKTMHTVTDFVCDVEKDLSTISKNPFGFSLGDSPVDTMYSVKDLFGIATHNHQTGPVYLGKEDNGDAISLDHWQSCTKITDMTGGPEFVFDIYFSAGDHSFSNTQQALPIKMAVNGTRSGATYMYHVYEFVYYKQGKPILPLDEVQRLGVMCDGPALNPPPGPMPAMSDQTTIDIETIRFSSSEDVLKTAHRFYFDKGLSVVRSERPYPAAESVIQKFGKYPIQKTFDFLSGLTYVINRIEGNCTVMPIMSSNDAAVFSSIDAKNPLVCLKTLGEVFDLDEKNMVYQGKKKLRELPVDAWAHHNGSSNEVTEAYFFKGSLSGIINHRKHDNKDILLYNYITDQSDGHPDVAVFDVSGCYDGVKYMNLEFEVEGTHEADIIHKRREFHSAVVQKILEITGLSVTRVGKLMAEETSKSRITVSFTIYEKHPKTSMVKAGSIEPAVPLDEAYRKLKDAFSQGININVVSLVDPTTKTFKTLADTFHEPSPMVQEKITTTTTGYGAGDIAGVAIGMLIIGAVTGLGVAYFIHKRTSKPGFPYEVEKS